MDRDERTTSLVPNLNPKPLSNSLASRSVVQKVDNAIRQISHYPEDKH